LYVTTEDFYFANNKLLDLADQFSKLGGKHIIIDEIHKYKGWSKELKLMYDYYPNLQVIFTGSSILDIKKGISDLSRRALMYHMQGLSFREYLLFFHQIKLPVYSLGDILNHKVVTEKLKYPLALFQDYLRRGYYPFGKQNQEYEKYIQQVVNQTLETDIPYYADMNVSTGRKLKQLLGVISKSVPFKPNFSNLGKILNVSRNNIADYCHYIEEAGLISQLRSNTGGVRGLGKVEKIFLDNSNLIYALAENQANIGSVRETFFMNQLREKHIIEASSSSDFEIEGITFEIGGKNKTGMQLQQIENGFIIKDDIEYGHSNIIPLWHFGFLY
jgi:predicted AAA+ superfamily ATPase